VIEWVMSEADSVDGRERRAESRKSWPIKRFRLGEEPTEDLLSTTTAGERLVMVGVLTERAWELSGREQPSYARAEMPIKRVELV